MGMGTEHNIESYRREHGTIRIPNILGIKDKDEIVEVVPITDSWLASPSRTWEEVDQVVTGRLEMFAQALLEPENSQLKLGQFFHVEKVTDPTELVLLSYAYLLDEYRKLEEVYKIKARSTRDEYEREKQQIISTSTKKGKSRRKVQIQYRTKYNPLIANHTHRAKEARTIQDHVLRRAFLDIFSFEGRIPWIAKRFAPSVEKLRKPSSIDETTTQKDPVIYLIDELSSYLQRIKDQELFQTYSYKPNPNSLIKRMDEAVVLDTVLRFSLRGPSLGVSQDTQEHLKFLADAFFTFLKRKNLLEVHPTASYPFLSLIHEIYSISLFRGDTQLIDALPNFLDTVFKDVILTKKFADEAVRCFNAWYEQYHKFKPELSQFPYSRLSEEYVFGQIMMSLLSDEFRLNMGISTLYEFAEKRSILAKNKVITKLSSLYLANLTSAKRPSSAKQDFLEFLQSIMIMPKNDYLKKIGVEVDILLFTNTQHFKSVTGDEISEQEKIDTIKQVLKEAAGNDALKERAILNYFIYLFLNSAEEKEIIGEENDILWHHVLNTSVWFVSPRGDRFHQLRDPQLTEYRIESITFFVDKQYPREHRVEVQAVDIPEPWVFWLDTQQNLLNEERQPPLIDPRFKSSLVNLLLKRLYIITSGILSPDQEVFAGEGLVPREFTYRRAHYKKLTSTTERPITMESYAARLHAAEILRDYGIDIYEEIKRRRSIGTLSPSEFVTFAKEVIPEYFMGSVLPNELSFDPESIEFPFKKHGLKKSDSI